VKTTAAFFFRVEVKKKVFGICYDMDENEKEKTPSSNDDSDERPSLLGSWRRRDDQSVQTMPVVSGGFRKFPAFWNNRNGSHRHFSRNPIVPSSSPSSSKLLHTSSKSQANTPVTPVTPVQQISTVQTTPTSTMTTTVPATVPATIPATTTTVPTTSLLKEVKKESLKSLSDSQNHIEQHFAVIDVEACDSNLGPIFHVGVVHGRYSKYHRHFIQYFQIGVERKQKEYSQKGWEFWETESKERKQVHDYLRELSKGWTEAAAMHQLASFLLNLRVQYPGITIAIDDWQVDGSLLNQALLRHNYLPIHRNLSGGYEPSCLLRDLMRGQFRLFRHDFVSMKKRGMYKAVQDMWNTRFVYSSTVRSSDFVATPPPSTKLIGNPNTINTKTAVETPVSESEISVISSSDFTCVNMMQAKHVPVIDALEGLHMFFNLEDIRCFIQDHFPWNEIYLA